MQRFDFNNSDYASFFRSKNDGAKLLQSYIDNSAVYHADKIHTPLLIFHGSEDRSVQPYQGMALFLALRRLQRPAWLLYYKNEGHQMGGEDNCRDFTEKLTGFFGYYLKNEPQPNWMK